MPAGRVAIFTGSFDPPTHVPPAGGEDAPRPRVRRGHRPAQPARSATATRTSTPPPIHRAVMADLAFRDLPGVTVDLSRPRRRRVHPARRLRRPARRPRRGVARRLGRVHRQRAQRAVHDPDAVGVRRGAVADRRGSSCSTPTSASPTPADRPPVCRTRSPPTGTSPPGDIRTAGLPGRQRPPGRDRKPSTRTSAATGCSPACPPARDRASRSADVRAMFVDDERNPKARALAERFRPLRVDRPDAILVLGGDGTMLAGHPRALAAAAAVPRAERRHARLPDERVAAGPT